MKNCDIIIPVFNAFDYLKKCVESVLIHTDLHINRLIIIDDRSTDERIIPFVEDLILGNTKNIIFIKNKENLGFIKTVNIGMRYSCNDILLLNSDTEVTKNWLDKIQKCAYLKERIATVTPLSNDAGIVSVPVFNKANQIPVGYNLDEYQSFIENISYKEYPEIPTGVGFCLYIKREALDVVGFFDEESYGKAYGEEEDFCYRCLSHGYRHVLCDDVIIFHKSSQSLSGYYQETLKERQKILEEKYPVYKSNAARWMIYHPLNYINKNINFNLCIKNGKINILIIIHIWDMQLEDNKLIGGTSLHVSDLIQELRDRYNFYILVPINGIYRLYCYWEAGNESIDIYSSFSQCYTTGFFDLEYSRMLKKIIKTYKINIIHIHHMIGHFFDMVDILKTEKVSLYITLHDYFSLCPRINKINNENKYCGYSGDNECNHCLKSYYNNHYNIVGIEQITAWRNVWSLLFSLADKIIVPSEAAKSEIIKNYEHLTIDVVEHGINNNRNIEELDIDTDKEFHIVFIGGISVIKGKTIIEELIKYTYQFIDNIYFHLFGYIDSDILEAGYKHFIYHGEYNRDELNVLFKRNNIKLVCIFSTWPETFCYTFAESIANNIPVLAIDYGAVGRRIKENNLGWLIKDDISASNIYKMIKNIFNDKRGYRIVSRSVLNYKIKNLQEMGNEYDKLYSVSEHDRNRNSQIEEIKIFTKENYLFNTTLLSRIDQINALNYPERVMTWFPRKIIGLIRCYADNGIKYTIKLLLKKTLKKILKYKKITECSLSENIQIYDIVVEKLKFNELTLRCGRTDPQIVFTFEKPLSRLNGDFFVEIKYRNTLAGNLKLYYNYSVGFDEKNSSGNIYIETATKRTTILIPIKGWQYGLFLTAIRIDPPDSTEFTIKSIKVLRK